MTPKDRVPPEHAHELPGEVGGAPMLLDHEERAYDLDVLVIDPDEGITGMLELALPDLTVDVCATATSADAVLERHWPRCVLLEPMLPGGQGLALLRRLVQMGLSVVVFTDDARDLSVYDGAGATVVARKPVTMADMRRLIGREIARSRQLDGLSEERVRLRFALRERLLQSSSDGVAVALVHVRNLPASEREGALSDVVAGLYSGLEGVGQIGRWHDDTLMVVFEPGAGPVALPLQERLECTTCFGSTRGVLPTLCAGVVEGGREPLRDLLVVLGRTLAAAKSQGPAHVAVATMEGAPTRRRVAVIDDDPTVALLVKAALTGTAIEVVGFEDPDAFFARAVQVDAVLLDVVMPEASGYDVLERMSARPAERDLPVALLSAKGSEEHVGLGLDLGAVDYLVKPFRPAELRERVLALLRRGSTERAQKG